MTFIKTAQTPATAKIKSSYGSGSGFSQSFCFRIQKMLSPTGSRLRHSVFVATSAFAHPSTPSTSWTGRNCRFSSLRYDQTGNWSQSIPPFGGACSTSCTVRYTKADNAFKNGFDRTLLFLLCLSKTWYTTPSLRFMLMIFCRCSFSNYMS